MTLFLTAEEIIKGNICPTKTIEGKQYPVFHCMNPKCKKELVATKDNFLILPFLISYNENHQEGLRKMPMLILCLEHSKGILKAIDDLDETTTPNNNTNRNLYSDPAY